MDGMCRIFLTVCNMSVTAVFVIVLVLLARMLLRRVPRRFSYYLWVIVAFRLVCPYSFSSAVSIFNLEIFGGHAAGNQAGWTDTAGLPGEERTQGTEGMPGETDPSGTDGYAEIGSLARRDGTALENAAEEAGSPPAGGRTAGKAGIKILTGLWILGAAVFLGIQIYSYQRLRKCVATAVRSEEGVYECGNIEVPFVMGIFKPVIYLPHGIAKSERNHILSHEQNHVRRHDYQVKFLAVLILSVYWFNPVVWLAYYLMCEDMEMSCDEKAVQTLNEEGKESYCQTLLNLASGDVRGLLPVGGTAFGGSSVKRRIKNILNLQSPKKQAAALGVVLCVLTVWIGLANGQQDVRIRCVKGPGPGAIEYEYRLAGNIQSFLIYKEYYQDGEMRDYEVVRADGIAEAGVKRNGKFTLNAERKLSEGRLVFQNQFEGEEASARDVTSHEMLGYYGYQGMAENYYQETQNGWQELQAGQELTLAAWHLLGTGQDEFKRIPCQEFMDPCTKQRAIRGNTGEILYYLVFSDKRAEELKEEYMVSPYAEALYEARNPYVGDAAANGNLLECMGLFPDMEWTTELQTKEEPYVLTVHYGNQPQDEVSFNIQMEKKAILLLCLIENAGRIEWTYPVETAEGQAERRFCCDRELAAKRLALEKAEDISGFGESRSSVQELLTEHIPFTYLNHVVNSIGIGTKSEYMYMDREEDVYLYCTYVVGRLPGESYDEVFKVLANEEGITMEDITDMFSRGRVPEDVCIERSSR